MPITQAEDQRKCTLLCNNDEDISSSNLDDLKNGIKSIYIDYLDEFLKSKVFISFLNKFVSQVSEKGASNGAMPENKGQIFDLVGNSDEVSPSNIRHFSGISPDIDFKKKTNYSGNILMPSSSNLVEKKESYEGLSTRMEKIESTLELISKKLSINNIPSSSEKIGAGLFHNISPSSSEKISAGLFHNIFPSSSEKISAGLSNNIPFSSSEKISAESFSNKPILANNLDDEGFKKAVRKNNRVKKSKPVLDNFDFVIRIITRNEKKRLFSAYPNLLHLSKLKESVDKFKMIELEILKSDNHNDFLKVENFDKLFYRNFNFCISIKLKNLTFKNGINLKPHQNLHNYKLDNDTFDKYFILVSGLINIGNFNKTFVPVPNTIKKFLWALSKEFGSTINIIDPVVKCKKMNLIINNLIKNNKLPNYLIKSKIKFEDNKFVFYDLLTNCQTEQVITTYKSLSNSNIDLLKKKFPILLELVFLHGDDESNYSKIQALIDSLRLNDEFPSDICFVNGNLQQKILPNLVISDENLYSSASDFLFDLGEFDLCQLYETDNDLKMILNLENQQLKLIESIFYLNYLKLQGKLIKPVQFTLKDYAINYLRNCALITCFTIDKITKLNLEDCTEWGASITNCMKKDSMFQKQCSLIMIDLKNLKLSKEIDTCNNIIAPEMIFKINSFFRFIEGHSSEVINQLEIIYQLGDEINKYRLKISNIGKDKVDAIELISRMIESKHKSLMSNKMKHWWPKSTGVVCSPELWKNVEFVLDYLQTFLLKLWSNNDSNNNQVAPVIIIKETTFNEKKNSECGVCGSSEPLIVKIINGERNEVCAQCEIDKPVPLPKNIIDTINENSNDDTIDANICPKCKEIKITVRVTMENKKVLFCKSCLIKCADEMPFEPVVYKTVIVSEKPVEIYKQSLRSAANKLQPIISDEK